MSEYVVEGLPNLEDRVRLESMHPDELVDHILGMGDEVAKLETKMNIASVVLEGAYGVTVEDVIKKREKNGEPN